MRWQNIRSWESVQTNEVPYIDELVQDRRNCSELALTPRHVLCEWGKNEYTGHYSLSEGEPWWLVYGTRRVVSLLMITKRNMFQAWGTWCVLGAHLQYACHWPGLHGALQPGLFDFPHDPHPLATQVVHQRYSTSGDLWAQEGLYAQSTRIYTLYWAGKLHGSHKSSKLQGWSQVCAQPMRDGVTL